jgi:hypothetical protein
MIVEYTPVAADSSSNFAVSRPALHSAHRFPVHDPNELLRPACKYNNRLPVATICQTRRSAGMNDPTALY